MAARNYSASDVIGRDYDLNTLLNRWWTNWRFTYTIGRGEFASEVSDFSYIYFFGTPASGISRVDKGSGRDSAQWPWYPHGTGEASRIDIESRLAQRKQAVANTDKLSVFVNSCEEIKGILESMLHKPKLDESDESDESEVIEDVNDR
jgi:hypothetical protein